MKFGKVDEPEGIDFTIPKDHPDTKITFESSGQKERRKLVHMR